MKYIYQLLLLAFCPATMFAQQNYTFIGHASGKPMLYTLNGDNQRIAQPLTGVTARNLLTGAFEEPDAVDVKNATPAFFNTFSWSKMVKAGKDDIRRLCMVGDSLLGFDEKNRVLFIAPRNGTFVKGDQVPVLTEARKAEQKADQKFMLAYEPVHHHIYFLRNGTLCRIAVSDLSKVEEVIKPIGGLRIIGFWLLSEGQRVLLKFVPSNITWNQYSSAYHDEILRLFDVNTGRPLQGLNLKNGMTSVFSSDGKRILSSTVEGGIHKGWLYDVEKGMELRAFGPAIVQRINTFVWTSMIDDRYLYNFPAGSSNMPFIKVYDLLDSLRPVNILQLGAGSAAEPPVLKASGPPTKFSAGTSIKQVLESLQLLQLPLTLNTFYKPVPGTELPPKLWNAFGFNIMYLPTGSVTIPTAADSAAGNFHVYAVGLLSSSPAGKSFLMASHHFHKRKPGVSDYESYSTLEYWFCTYDNKTGTVKRQRLVAGDEKFYVTEISWGSQNRTTIQKKGDSELVFRISSSDGFTFNTETFEIKR